MGAPSRGRHVSYAHPSHDKWHRSLDLIVRSLLEILVIAIFAATFIAQPFRVPSQSMEPTLRTGDFGIADKQSFAPESWASPLLPPTTLQRGDLVIFHFPPDPTQDLVKRVVALPGERLRLSGGHLVLNGTRLAEPYASFQPGQPNAFRDDFPFLRDLDPSVDPTWWADLRANIRNGEITVPAAAVFVLGDNRNNSDDSRYWGFVPVDYIVGRPLCVYIGPPHPEDRTPSARLHSLLHSPRILR